MNPHRRYNPADEPLWLVIQRDEQSRCFEFPPNTPKAIVVGSSESADVRIRSAAPVAFFLERDSGTIWLIPAYPEVELRLDTLKVDGKRRIYTHGLVELGDVELRLRVRDTPPTLRGDGLVRMQSEISDPMSKRAATALNDLTATTTIDASTVTAVLRQCATTTISRQGPIPDMASLTKTIETDAFDFDGWFDDAVKEEPGKVTDTQPVAPVSVPTPMSAAPTSPTPARSPATVSRPPRPRMGPPNIKTQELGPIQWPPAPSSEGEAPSTPKGTVVAPDASTPRSNVAGIPSPEVANSSDRAESDSLESLSMAAIVPVEAPPLPNDATPAGARVASDRQATSTSKSSAKIDPFRTIEIGPIRLSEPTPAEETAQPKLETLRQTTTIQIGTNLGGETTDFDVPVASPTVAQPGTGTASSAPTSPNDAPRLQERRPMIVKAPAPAPQESFESNVPKRLPSLATALEKLGLRAKRQPVLVFGGAAIASFVLVLFFIGVAKMLSPHPTPRTERAVAAQATTTQTSARAERSTIPVGAAATEIAATGSAAPQPPVPAEAKSEDVPAAIAAPPDVAPAVGHLFSGRLPEAEQAYRDLATKFPKEPVFHSAARILARKNSPNCRGVNLTKTACPSVKP